MRADLFRPLIDKTSYIDESLFKLPKRPPYRIYISVHGEGYGHSSRALAVASHFHPESVVFGSYGYVYDRLKRSGYETVEIGPEVRFFGEDGSFEIAKTILKNSAWPIIVRKLAREEARIMKEYDVSCVLTDCRSAAVFAAAKLGLPCIFMTNQTQFDHFFQRRTVSDLKSSLTIMETTEVLQDAILSGAAEPTVELASRAVFKEIDEIVIADFPSPDTVCLPILSRRKQIMKRQRMVGPVTAWREEEVVAAVRPGPGPYIVGILGGHQYRLPLFNALIEAAHYLPHVQFQIFSNFRVANKPANVRIDDFSDHPERFYKAADLVVTQSGHSTAMELLSLGKPSILVPDYKQIEQESNAKRMCQIGVSTEISYPELTGRRLADRMLHHLDTPSYELNARRMARLARQLDGSRRVAEIVNDYALRVLAY